MIIMRKLKFGTRSMKIEKQRDRVFFAFLLGFSGGAFLIPLANHQLHFRYNR